jgi:hypothetical protein
LSAVPASEEDEQTPDLWKVHMGRGAEGYSDPASFFSQTIFTPSIQDLLFDAQLRLSGRGGEPVVILKDGPNAGKTHSLLALYHLSSGVKFSDLPGLRPAVPDANSTTYPRVPRVVLAGSGAYPNRVREETAGTAIRTLWGELAWQLGGREGYDLVRKADEDWENPGESIEILLQRFSPCLILIDDWVAYARQLYSHAGLPKGTFDAHLGFAQALSRAVALTDNALLVVSMSGTQDGPNETSTLALIDRLTEALDSGRRSATEDKQSPQNGNLSQLQDTQLLDDLFRATVAYSSSTAYRDLLNYVTRFRRYSAYNAFLVRIQRPTVGYVATPNDWAREFERRVKPDARPLVMLRPFGPVMFVFDIADTDGKPAPPDLMNPFDAKGTLDSVIWNNTVGNASHDRINVIAKDMPVTSAGSAACTRPPGPKQVPEFEVTYNKSQKLAEAYCTLAHELAHIYLGHVCGHPKNKWPDRRDRPKDVREFEAESTSYIVCARQGLMTTAPKYLADYLGHNASIPPIDMHRVLVVASKIEEMGRALKKPKKKGEEEDEG